jgi:hypothetical protein
MEYFAVGISETKLLVKFDCENQTCCKKPINDIYQIYSLLPRVPLVEGENHALSVYSRRPISRIHPLSVSVHIYVCENHSFLRAFQSLAYTAQVLYKLPGWHWALRHGDIEMRVNHYKIFIIEIRC